MNGQAKYRYTGDLTLPVPVDGVTVGAPVEIGGFFGFSQATVTAEDAADGEEFTMKRSGVFKCETDASNGAIAVGDAIYFDADAVGALFSNADGRLVGYAASALADAATGTVLVVVDIYPVTTAPEAIEDAGGLDA